MEKGNPGRVTCIFGDEGRHDLQDGDTVSFKEVIGMTELNGQQFKVKVINPYTFTIGDISGFQDYAKGGIVVQEKQHVTLQYLPLAKARLEPGEFLLSDFAKFGRSELIHLAFMALDAFRTKHGAYPEPHSEEHAKEFIALATSLRDTVAESSRPELDEKVLREFSYGARAVVNPVAALFGGIVGQEIIKACTSKFHPIKQFFYMDALEALPAEPLPKEEFQLENSRYDSNIMVFGRSFQERLKRLKVFVVGSGALGCEIMKNCALLGVAGSKDGLLTITDDDKIERSNLSRQFLFRNWDVGKNKSSAAGAAALRMNPDFNIRPLTERVSQDTTDVFNDTFWNSLDVVLNALDNVNARRYVDARCVFFNKPLLESGTLGTKCNVQVVVPHLTQNYGATNDPPEKTAPECTVHYFPHNIDHCLTWSRSEFVGNFERFPTDTNRYLETDDFVHVMESSGAKPSDILQSLRGDEVWGGGIYDCLHDRPHSFDDCIRWARVKFETYANHMVKQLIQSFPENAVNKKTGKSFWSPPKRFPKAIEFDAQNDAHLEFVIAAANLRANIFGVPLPEKNREAETFFPVLAKIHVLPFVPKSNVQIKADDDEAAGGSSSSSGLEGDDSKIAKILERLPKRSELPGLRMMPEEFEKDNDLNFHVDFIHSLANLRAISYGIDPVTKLQAKLQAGRIIPAIATTTAMVTGFVAIELFKLINKKPLESYRDSFANLAIPLFAMSEPLPPKKSVSRTEKSYPDPLNHPEYVEENEIVAFPEGHTAWDHLKVNIGDVTLQEFINFFKKEHKLDLTSMSIGRTLVYASFMPDHKSRLPVKVTELVVKIGQQQLGNATYLVPVCNFQTLDGNEAETPEIIFTFKN